MEHSTVTVAATASPRKILVATDASRESGAAVRRAAQLSHEHGARLSAVQTVPPEFDAERAKSARHSLEAHLDEYAEPGSVDIAIRAGAPAREVAAEAADREADLVVAGAHDARCLSDTLQDGCAEGTMRKGPAALLLVKTPSNTAYRTAVLATDTSAPSAYGARFAAALTPEAEHILVHICTVVGENLMRMYGAADDQIDELQRTSTENAREYVRWLSETLSPAPARSVIASGHPPTRLVQMCSSLAADLVVVGTGARSPVSYALLGSMAEHVVRQCPSDVLVVPAA